MSISPSAFIDVFWPWWTCCPSGALFPYCFVPVARNVFASSFWLPPTFPHPSQFMDPFMYCHASLCLLGPLSVLILPCLSVSHSHMKSENKLVSNSKEWEGKPQSGRKCLQKTHLTKDYYPEYVKNSSNSTISFTITEIWSFQPMYYTDAYSK